MAQRAEDGGPLQELSALDRFAARELAWLVRSAMVLDAATSNGIHQAAKRQAAVTHLSAHALAAVRGAYHGAFGHPAGRAVIVHLARAMALILRWHLQSQPYRTSGIPSLPDIWSQPLAVEPHFESGPWTLRALVERQLRERVGDELAVLPPWLTDAKLDDLANRSTLAPQGGGPGVTNFKSAVVAVIQEHAWREFDAGMLEPIEALPISSRT